MPDGSLPPTSKCTTGGAFPLPKLAEDAPPILRTDLSPDGSGEEEGWCTTPEPLPSSVWMKGW